MTGRRLLILATLALAAGPALAATPAAPPLLQPKTYEPPKVTAEQDASCLAETVNSGQPDAEIILRNTCALRINFALCVRRSDDAAAEIVKGSLSPAAVHVQDVKFGPKTRTFHHAATFCPGLTCVVTEPTC